jgi:hypothetical protein
MRIIKSNHLHIPVAQTAAPKLAPKDAALMMIAQAIYRGNNA